MALRVIPRYSDLSRAIRDFYRELVEIVAKDPLCEVLGLSADELCSFWSWVPAADYVSNPEFSLTRQLFQNRVPLNDVDFREGLPDCHRSDLGLEQTASHDVYRRARVSPFLDYFGESTARITFEKLVLIDLAYVCDSVSTLYSVMKRMVI